jgi:hypothetical protein
MSNGSELPPPAYEVSQQELDQKISAAYEASLSTVSTGADGNEDDWEYDEAAFEAAFSAAQANAARQTLLDTSGSNAQQGEPYSTPVQPLQVKKKDLPELRLKERPSWYVEAGLTGSPSHPTSSPGLLSPYQAHTPNHGASSKERQSWCGQAGLEAASPSSVSFAHTISSGSGSFYDIGPTNLSPSDIVPSTNHEIRGDDDDDDASEPPPAFTAVGPSLEGPPFEEVVLTYRGSGSNPPSPLLSPQPTPFLNGSNRHSRRLSPVPTLNTPQIPTRPHSIPSPPKEHLALGPRPFSTSSGRSNQLISGSRMDFNHSVAYHKAGFEEMPTAPVPYGGTATSFYKSVFRQAVSLNATDISPHPSSAVVGHMTNRPARSFVPPTRPHP